MSIMHLPYKLSPIIIQLPHIQEINISPGLFSVGPWGANLITIKEYSFIT